MKHFSTLTIRPFVLLALFMGLPGIVLAESLESSARNYPSMVKRQKLPDSSTLLRSLIAHQAQAVANNRTFRRKVSAKNLGTAHSDASLMFAALREMAESERQLTARAETKKKLAETTSSKGGLLEKKEAEAKAARNRANKGGLGEKVVNLAATIVVNGPDSSQAQEALDDAVSAYESCIDKALDAHNDCMDSASNAYAQAVCAYQLEVDLFSCLAK